MSTTNYPSATPQSQAPKKDYRGLIIGLLAVGLLGTWGYLLWNNNKNEQSILVKDSQIARVTDEKRIVLNRYFVLKIGYYLNTEKA